MCPNVKWERFFGREFIELLNNFPKVRWVREEGRIESTGWLNESPNIKWVRFGGRELIVIIWLKDSPNSRNGCCCQRGVSRSIV